jgi:hypothetical protein
LNWGQFLGIYNPLKSWQYASDRLQVSAETEEKVALKIRGNFIFQAAEMKGSAV